jgi:hypothetical protein
MAEEQSKFSGVLAKLKQPPAEPPAPQRPTRPTSSIEVNAVRGRGRPPGKRSDPDDQPTTVLLRKQTKKMASRLLEDTSSGQDLSELIEQLLTEWIQQRS